MDISLILNTIKKSLLIPESETFADSELRLHILSCIELIKSTGVSESSIYGDSLAEALIIIYVKTFFGFKNDGTVKELPTSFDKLLTQLTLTKGDTMSFPNSPNIRLKLIKARKCQNKYKIESIKEITGIERSLTTNEFSSNAQTKLNITRKILIISFLYNLEKFVEINGEYYKVERTYDSGQYVEIYLSITPLTKDDFING
jgi:hypothetical protein